MFTKVDRAASKLLKVGVFTRAEKLDKRRSYAMLKAREHSHGASPSEGVSSLTASKLLQWIID